MSITTDRDHHEPRMGFLRRPSSYVERKRKLARARTARWRQMNKLRKRPDTYQIGMCLLAAAASVTTEANEHDATIVRRMFEMLRDQGFDWIETHKMFKALRERLSSSTI